MAFPEYVLTNNGVSISTAITVLQLQAGTAGPIELLRVSLTQSSSATSAQIRARVLRKSAGATVTTAVAGTHLQKLNPVNPTSNANLGTSNTGITASAEGTDSDILAEIGFNVLNGMLWLPVPEERFIVPQGGIIALKFPDAPPSATWNAQIYFRELRGG